MTLHQLEALCAFVVLLGVALVVIGGRGLRRGMAQRPGREREKYRGRHIRPRGYRPPAAVPAARQAIAAPTIAAPTVAVRIVPGLPAPRQPWDGPTVARPGWRNIRALVAPSASPLTGWRLVAMSR